MLFTASGLTVLRGLDLGEPSTKSPTFRAAIRVSRTFRGSLTDDPQTTETSVVGVGLLDEQEGLLLTEILDLRVETIDHTVFLDGETRDVQL
jgi:hypothetical protein